MNAGQHTPDSDVVEPVDVLHDFDRLDDAQRIDSLRGLLAELPARTRRHRTVTLIRWRHSFDNDTRSDTTSPVGPA